MFETHKKFTIKLKNYNMGESENTEGAKSKE